MSIEAKSPSPHKLSGSFRLAVLIMSAISAVTTALGAIDLFGDIMAWALAIGISVLLVALAFAMPEAYQNGRHVRLILGYTFIALISVLFNFNYIYGKFASEDLLYAELQDKRELVDVLEIKALSSMDKKLGVEELRNDIKRYDEVMKREEVHPVPGESGKGPRYADAAMKKQLALEKLNVGLTTKGEYYQKIESASMAIKQVIDSVLESGGNIQEYKTGIETSVTGYNELRNYVQREFPELVIEPFKFINKDIGKLNHTLWSFTQMGNLSGKQVASLLLAMVIAIAIDFVVLFVLAVVNSAHKQDYKDPYSRPRTYDGREILQRRPPSRQKDEDIFHKS